jgi:hypothetical protein
MLSSFIPVSNREKHAFFGPEHDIIDRKAAPYIERIVNLGVVWEIGWL